MKQRIFQYNKRKTLQEILEHENRHRREGGVFGIKACKESIISAIEIDHKYGGNKTLYSLLEEYVQRANEEIFFNDAMVLACWELINGIE